MPYRITYALRHSHGLGGGGWGWGGGIEGTRRGVGVGVAECVNATCVRYCAGACSSLCFV